MESSGEVNFTSEAQERLFALLTKAVDVLPYASDEACDGVFTHLASFCTGALQKMNARKQAKKFSLMNVEDLIALAQHMPATEDLADERKVVPSKNATTADSPVEQKKATRPVPAAIEAPPGRKKTKTAAASLDSDVESGEGDVKRRVREWEFSQAYNIVQVLDIKADPFLVQVTARPPVAGNQTAKQYHMSREDFDSVGDQKGRQGTKLRKRFLSALEAYCESLDDVPAFLVKKLKEFEWSQELGKKLEGQE